MWNNFKKMPFFLKLIAFHGFIFFVGAFVCLLPIPGMFSIDDKKVSYSEWLATGTGFVFFLVALSIGVGAICLLKRVKHARKFYLIAFVCALLVYIHGLNQESPNHEEAPA